MTPPVSCGALPGITRALVLELATSLTLDAVEQVIGIDDVLAADEAFLTSSLRGIVPLVRLDGRAIGRGEPGPSTGRLREAHARLVERECRT